MNCSTIRNRLKIVYITRGEFGLLGGAATYMLPANVSKSHDVLVLETKKTDPLNESLVVFHGESVRIVNICGRTNRKREQKLKRILNKFNPDIIHIFQSPRCLRDVSSIRKLSSQYAIVLDFRTPLYAKKFSWLHVNKLLKFFFSQFYIDWVITHSSNTLPSNLPVRLTKFTEISPGVDMRKFDSVRKNKKYPKHFVYIGTLARTRKIELLIEYFINAVNTYGLQLTLDIYGQGDAVNGICELIGKASLQNNISLKGVLPQTELFTKLKNYDAGIAYVPDNEDWAVFSKAPTLKSLEYAAAGLPIVASFTEGHVDYIKRYGFEFELFDNSIDSFSLTMGSVIKKGFANSMVQNNLNVIKQFNWSSIVKSKLIPLYTKLIKDKNK